MDNVQCASCCAGVPFKSLLCNNEQLMVHYPGLRAKCGVSSMFRTINKQSGKPQQVNAVQNICNTYTLSFPRL